MSDKTTKNMIYVKQTNKWNRINRQMQPRVAARVATARPKVREILTMFAWAVNVEEEKNVIHCLKKNIRHNVCLGIVCIFKHFETQHFEILLEVPIFISIHLFSQHRCHAIHPNILLVASNTTIRCFCLTSHKQAKGTWGIMAMHNF